MDASRLLRLVPRAPFDIATHRGINPKGRRLSAKHRIQSAAQIIPVSWLHRRIVIPGRNPVGPGFIKLTVVNEPVGGIKHIDIGRTCRSIGPSDLLRFVVEVWKRIASLTDLQHHIVETVIRVCMRIIAVYRDKSDTLLLVLSGYPSQSSRDMDDIGAMVTDEHNHQAPMTAKALQRNSLPPSGG